MTHPLVVQLRFARSEFVRCLEGLSGEEKCMLIPDYNQDIPESTVQVARAAFPKGNPYLTLRDRLGTIFED